MDNPSVLLDNPNMGDIPIYSLYGEARGTGQSGWLHVETIPARSRMHGFAIAPHRHEEFFQLVLMSHGTGQMQIDGQSFALAAGSLAVVPAWAVHSFVFSEDVDGLVLTLRERDLREGGLLVPVGQGLTAPEPLLAAFHGLIEEANRFELGQDLAMRARIALLAVALARATEAAAPAAALHLAEGFRDLVNLHYAQTRSVADYAARLGVSQTHLGRISRAAFGLSPLAVIEGRIALEARRLLIFSALPVREIAERLGYEDAAYFTRAMTKLLGKAPSQLRQEAR